LIEGYVPYGSLATALIWRFPMNIVEEVERRFLSSLKTTQEEISNEFPKVNARLTSFRGGSLTDNLSHVFAIECLLTTASANQTDNVALDILLEHIDTRPTIYSSITWGHPSGYTEAEAFPEVISVSDDALTELEARLPFLCDRLKAVLARGKPSNE